MAVGRIYKVVALTGLPYKEKYGRLAEPKKSGRNEVIVRRSFTVMGTILAETFIPL